MLGLGAGAWGAGCLGAQASARTSAARAVRVDGMQILAGGCRVKRRENEGTEVRPRVIGGDAKNKGELVSGLFRRDDGVDEAARAGKLGVELVLVVRPHRGHGCLGL